MLCKKNRLFLASFLLLISIPCFATDVVDTSIIDAENANTESSRADFKLQTFSSCESMESVVFEYLKKSIKFWGYYGHPRMMPMIDIAMEDGDMAISESAAPTASKMAADGVGGASDDFSATNIQVAGVDEAEIVKTDGDYVYFYHQTDPDDYQSYAVSIADVRTDDVEVVKQIQLPNNYNGVQLLLDDNKLIIVANRYRPYNERRPVEPFLGIHRDNKVAVIIYDVSNPADLELERFYVVDGNLSQIRRIKDKIYVLSQNSIFINPWAIYNEVGSDDLEKVEARFEEEFSLKSLTPRAIDIALTNDEKKFTTTSSGKKYPFSVDQGLVADCDEIDYYLPDEDTQEEFDTDAQFLILSVIDTDSPQKEVDRKVLFGDAGQIYMSQESLYVVGSHYSYWGFACPADARCFAPWFPSHVSSIVHKFDVDGADVDYVDTAIVPGRPLTQYAMHDDGEYFYTANQITSPERSTAVYVLDEDMDHVSRIEDIAPGEDFRSSRYMGDKLYLVTFETTDPLFTIDLSNPRDIKILGELKIPGFSTYLHPYDDEHLIGVGYDTQENKWWGVVTHGVKVDLYDVSDFSAPKQKFTKTFGGRGSSSEVTSNPRMFVWDARRNLLLFPAQLMEQDEDSYRYTSGWQGGLVLSVDKNAGIEKVAEFTHIDMDGISDKRKEDCERYGGGSKEPECYTHITTGEEICVDQEEEYRGRIPEYCFAEFDDSTYLAQNIWQFNSRFIDRILYIGDRTFGLSDAKLTVHDMSDGYEEIGGVSWGEE